MSQSAAHKKKAPSMVRSPWLLLMIGVLVVGVVVGWLVARDTPPRPSDQFNQELADSGLTFDKFFEDPIPANVSFVDPDGDEKISYYLFVACWSSDPASIDVDAWQPFVDEVTDTGTSVRLAPDTDEIQGRAQHTMTVTVDFGGPVAAATAHAKKTLAILRQSTPCR